MDPQRPHHQRRATYPLYFSSRRKPRRWPLVLRFVKGAMHRDIALPVMLHAIFAAIIVYFDQSREATMRLPSSIIPSLSIVVGLMLVFRNQTSYDRFWTGQNQLTLISTCVRNLTRSFLTCSHSASGAPPTDSERADTENAVRVLLAYMYAVKTHLRAEWGVTVSSLMNGHGNDLAQLAGRSDKPDFGGLLPNGMRNFTDQGLGLPLQLSIATEAYIKRGHDRGWFHAPQASQLTVQLNTAVQAYGSMETIRLTPIPVAYLIHMKQVLALFGCVLPFAMVADMGWWAVLIVSMVTFTLYGIEGIGQQLEDPFGYDKNDIKMDAIVEDLRVEVMVMLDQWRIEGSMFAA